jgi:alpha-L-fucosidase
MIGVLRGGAGICEDIITPELVFPDSYIDVPWEVCTVMSKPKTECALPKWEPAHTSFGYTFDIDYMSAKEIAHLLLDVVSKGGNLALNLAPQPDGRLPLRAVGELKILSKWMAKFGSAIHGTRSVAPYRTESYAFTRSKDAKTVNAFYLYNDRECIFKNYTIPFTADVEKVTFMRTGEEVPFIIDGGKLVVTMPENLVAQPADIADCFNIKIK